MVTTEQELKSYLNDLESRLEKISDESGELSFQRYVDKQPKTRLVELEKERSSIVLDKALHETIAKWHGHVADPLLARRVEVWQGTLLGFKVTAREDVVRLTRELSEKVIAHKYNVNGERIDLGALRGLLRANPDRQKRKSAFESLAELSQKAEVQLLELIGTRNSAAQELGYATYVDLCMKLGGMTTPQVESILLELTRATDPVYKDIIQTGAEKLGISDVQPWDIQYILEQGGQIDKSKFPVDKINPSLESYIRSMGYESLAKLNIAPRTVDIPYNGLCMAITRKDIRMLTNPQDGFAYYKTAFHEMGHALHSALNGQEHMGLRRESGIFTEGIAEIFGYIPQHPDWLRSMGLTEDEVKGARTALLGPLFHYLRQRTVYCLFEHAMYKNTNQDLDALMGKIESEILGCGFNASPRWASNAWYVNYPVYWHNYVLADVISSQIHENLRENIGDLYNSKAAFDYVVKTYIAPGASIPWLEKISKGTGYELSAKALINDLTT